MKSIIASKNYNPGHFSHMIANAKLLKKNGYEIYFRWHDAFNSMFTGLEGLGEIPRNTTLLTLKAGDLFIVWFPSISVLFDMLAVRIFTSARIIYVYHEPFESISAYLDSGFDWKKTVRIVLISYVNRLLAFCSNTIILPSAKAFNTYRLKYHSTKPYAYIPLLFDDESYEFVELPKRRYVSYIGTIAADHAFDKYVDFVEEALKSPKMFDLDFLIATRTKLPANVRDRLQNCIFAGRVRILEGAPLSNKVINLCYAQSWIVWNAYRRSMQSGVLPKSYMFGTPVLTTELNRSEFFINGMHGAEIESTYQYNEIESAILTVKENFLHISNSCKDMFLKTFYYEANSDSFIKLVS